ncbi:MAG: UbiA family prenyltransferase [Schleiferiaceae bacterium]|jgi:4-hydroxybenzoate polyprenyltransferase|nr:UbiA family prenyltransferase [Schleiferiaceae bacterium]
MASGFILGRQKDVAVIFLLLWIDIIGIFTVYRLNDCIDQNESFEFNLRQCLSYKKHQWALVQLAVIIPLSFMFISREVFNILAIAAIAGTLYSLTLRVEGKRYRIKNMFFLKNILIGLSWGALILVGAGTVQNPLVISMFLFASIQVFIGSIIRDIPDVEKDKENGVNSIPVVNGIPWTLKFLQITNVLSLASIIWSGWSFSLFFIFFVVVVWRAYNLYFLRKDKTNPKWTQSINLYTCVLIFFVTLVMAYL